MMRMIFLIASLYSNENLSIDLVEKIREFGHDVLTSYQAGQANQGIPDDDVLAYATTNQRSVVTFNRDDLIISIKQLVFLLTQRLQQLLALIVERDKFRLSRYVTNFLTEIFVLR
jgi:Domain of unknown function (DUF5615)